MNTKHVSRRLRRFTKAKEAVSALEYAILVGVVTVAVGSGIALFSQNVLDAIAGIGGQVTTTTGTIGNATINQPTTVSPSP